MLPSGSISYIFTSGLEEIALFLAVYFLILICAAAAKKLPFQKAFHLGFFCGSLCRRPGSRRHDRLQHGGRFISFFFISHPETFL